MIIKRDYAWKYLKRRVKVVVDRPRGSVHPEYGYMYEVNYGYVPESKALDGEEVDVYILGVNEPLESFEGDCIAIIHRVTDDENDDKLVVVPEGVRFGNNYIRERTDFQEKFHLSKIVRRTKYDEMVIFIFEWLVGVFTVWYVLWQILHNLGEYIFPMTYYPMIVDLYFLVFFVIYALIWLWMIFMTCDTYFSDRRKYRTVG